MVNSLTCAWAEVAGRSYGGGVLELEPREAEALWVPFEFAAELDADYLDGCLRDGDADAALAHGDQILLRQGCGLSERDIELARSARRRLLERRQRRGKRRAASASA